MANWTSMGHAMRRRMGMPSNHHESAGTSMSRNNPTPEEVLASADHAGSPRRYMGMDALGFDNVSAAPGNTTAVPRKNTQAADLSGQKGGPRPQILAERLGARYAISVAFPAPASPEAGATMANARIVPSVQGRVAPNFDASIRDQY
jgi:hypothetical protein